MKNFKKTTAGELIFFSLPLILSGMLQQLYSWVDAFIVGHAEGELQLGAIGATTVVTMLFLHTIIGFTLGLSILSAQEFGRGNFEKIKRIFETFLPLLLGVYTIVSLVSVLATEFFLRLLDTPADIFDYAYAYLKIALLGMPFLAVYNTCAAILRALGNTKVAFYAVALSAAFNFVLDILLVVILPYGVAGASAATVLSQVAMTVFIVLYTRKKYPDYMPRRFCFDREAFSGGLAFGIPPVVQHSITAVGNLVLQNFMNGFGAVTVLAVTTAYRVDMLTLLPVLNLGAAISNLVARSKGAQEIHNIRKYFKTGMLLMISIGVCLSLMVFFFGAYFVGIFGVGGEALAVGKQFFRDLAFFYTIFGIASVFRAALEGIGDITCCSIISVVTLGLRIGLSYLFRGFVGNRAIAFAEGCSWVFLLLMLTVRACCKRRELGLVKQKTKQ